MTRLFRRSFLLNLDNTADDLSLTVTDRYIPMLWPTLFIVSFAFTVLAAWLFTARIPVTLEARGIILPLGGVREVVSSGEGLVRERTVFNDAKVAAGDILLSIANPTTAAEYDNARRQYQAEQSLLAAERLSSKQVYQARTQEFAIKIAARKANLVRLQDIATSLEVAIAEYKTTEQAMLDARQQAAKQITQLYDEMESGVKRLRDKGISSERDYIQFQSERNAALQSLAGIVTEMSNAKVKQRQLQHELSSLHDKIAGDMTQEQELLHAQEEASNEHLAKQKEIDLRSLKSQIRLLDAERRLWARQHVFSPYDGELVSVKKAPGQQVAGGEAVALLNMVPQTRKLLLVLSTSAHSGFFKLGFQDQTVSIPFKHDRVVLMQDIEAALADFVPDVRFSLRTSGGNIVLGIMGENADLLSHLTLVDTDLMDVTGMPVFATLLAIGDHWNEQDLSAIALLQPEDGKRVKVGDFALLKPNFEKSLIGAQIKAYVTHVSSYVATAIQMQSLIGSSEIAQFLAGEGGRIAVILKLERNAVGDLLLDGDELSRPLSTGTLMNSYIEVESVSPLSILLPFYADLAG